MTKVFSIDEQIEAMASTWPEFSVVQRIERAARWRGVLCPFFAKYEVEITYRSPLLVELIDPMRQQPDVRIINPPLRRMKGHPEGSLPHVYWDNDGSTSLCLFDPVAHEWTPMCLLSETTVPWTIDWLSCYEGWRATGKWSGGGKHASQLNSE